MKPFNRALTSAGIAILALAGVATPELAHAEWRKAETRHFVVYSDGSEGSLRDYAVELERIDQLMRAFFILPEAQGDRPLSVYLVGSRQDFETTSPGLPTGIGGVYSASFRDIRVVLIRAQGDEVLRHEYGHHFMFRNFPGAYPTWFKEGFADFFRTATVASNGRGAVGRSSPMRIQILNSERWLPWDQVLTGRAIPAEQSHRGVFYAQSWLLTHWAMTDAGRRQRMDAYLRDTARGVAVETALQTHFGMGVEQLGETLRAYLRAGPRFAELDLGAAATPAPVIATLPASADDMLLMDVDARNGGRPEEDANF